MFYICKNISNHSPFFPVGVVMYTGMEVDFSNYSRENILFDRWQCSNPSPKTGIPHAGLLLCTRDPSSVPLFCRLLSPGAGVVFRLWSRVVLSLWYIPLWTDPFLGLPFSLLVPFESSVHDFPLDSVEMNLHFQTALHLRILILAVLLLLKSGAPQTVWLGIATGLRSSLCHPETEFIQYLMRFSCPRVLKSCCSPGERAEISFSFFPSWMFTYSRKRYLSTLPVKKSSIWGKLALCFGCFPPVETSSVRCPTALITQSFSRTLQSVQGSWDRRSTVTSYKNV